MDHHHHHKEAFKGRYFYFSQFGIWEADKYLEAQDPGQYHDLPIGDHLVNIEVSVVDL
jgi:hypothetical protein